MLIAQTSSFKPSSPVKTRGSYGQDLILSQPLGYGAAVSLNIPGLFTLSTTPTTTPTQPPTFITPTVTPTINWTPIIILGIAAAGILALILIRRKRST
jgi:LPXTG-motif cell wall-anchored protein